MIWRGSSERIQCALQRLSKDFRTDLCSGPNGPDLSAHTPNLGGVWTYIFGFTPGRLDLDGSGGLTTVNTSASGPALSSTPPRRPPRTTSFRRAGPD